MAIVVAACRARFRRLAADLEARATALPTSPPEAQGIPSGAILAFVDAVEREVAHPHGFVLLRRGTVVAEGYWAPYRAGEPHMQFSLAKTFTATAIGLLVAEGRLSVDDRVIELFPDRRRLRPHADLPLRRRPRARRAGAERLLRSDGARDAGGVRCLLNRRPEP